MTEPEAKEWLARQQNVSRETLTRLERFAALLIQQNAQQNLIARSTVETIWSRHIVDSAQLANHLSSNPSDQPVLDLGSGPGLPGLVLAIMQPHKRFALVESRRKRCDFLLAASVELGLRNTDILCSNLKSITPFPADAITARAFAPLRELIDMARPFSDRATRWVLPRGQKGVKEWQELPRKLKAMFHVEQSLTDDRAVILVGEGAA